MKMHDRILWLGNGVNLTNHHKDWVGIQKELEGDTEHPIVTADGPDPFTMMYDSLLFAKRRHGFNTDVADYPQLRTAERMGGVAIMCGKDYPDIYPKSI